MSGSSLAMRASRPAWAWSSVRAAPGASCQVPLERDDNELSRAGGSLCSVKEIWMQDRQVLVGYSIAIQQDVFRATTPGVRKNSVKVRRDVGHGVFRCTDKPAMTGFPSGQLARDMVVRIAEHAIVELPVEPHPCLWR